MHFYPWLDRFSVFIYPNRLKLYLLVRKWEQYSTALTTSLSTEWVLPLPSDDLDHFQRFFFGFYPLVSFFFLTITFFLLRCFKSFFLREKVVYLDKHNKYKFYLKWKMGKVSPFLQLPSRKTFILWIVELCWAEYQWDMVTQHAL